MGRGILPCLSFQATRGTSIKCIRFLAFGFRVVHINPLNESTYKRFNGATYFRA
jgi:hypothetical protein